MRRSKEILVLVGLLLAAVVFVLWYVADRRAQMRAQPPAPRIVGPAVPATPVDPPAPVDLTKHDGDTIDFSTGRPVVKNTPEDQAAIDAAKKDMDAALEEVSFDPPKKPAEPRK